MLYILQTIGRSMQARLFHGLMIGLVEGLSFVRPGRADKRMVIHVHPPPMGI